MKAEVIESPALTLLGCEAPFIGPMSPDPNNHKVIPALFAEFERRQAEVPTALDGFTYGACQGAPEARRTREDELLYLVSVRVAEDAVAPQGMKIWRVPATRYAWFRHQGVINRIGETYHQIFSTWLPQSGYETTGAPILERYDERFRGGGEQCEVDILLPVKPRAKAAK